jgi:three-Cys-motif partner protein
MDKTNTTSNFLEPLDDGLPMSEWGHWAKDKLNVLARYIITSTTAMSSKTVYWRRRFYIDLQAGPGKNYVKERPDDIFLGSPLLALTQGAGYTDYRFVEWDSSRADALRKRCEAADLKPFQTLNVFAGNCNDVVDQIVKEINDIDKPPFSRTDWNSLSLAFLDPEGLELDWETVLKLVSLKRTDIVINFSTGGLKRTAEQALSMSRGEARADKFFGTSDWRDIPRRPDGSMPVHEWIEFYKQRLTDKTGGEYQWGTSISVKNRRGVEMYRLLFASKDKLGITLWEDARKKGPDQLSLF